MDSSLLVTAACEVEGQIGELGCVQGLLLVVSHISLPSGFSRATSLIMQQLLCVVVLLSTANSESDFNLT